MPKRASIEYARPTKHAISKVGAYDDKLEITEEGRFTPIFSPLPSLVACNLICFPIDHSTMVRYVKLLVST
jgi:hypothetical protein